MMNRNTMEQWMNLHRNNIFVNRMQLPLLCEKSGAILLVLVGLTAGQQAVIQNTGRFENFKNSLRITSVGFLQCLMKIQCYYSVTNAFQSVFY